MTEKTFAAFYPYPPHFIDLSIDIMSGIRLQTGAPRHLGGSNRTIIGQAYAMLTSERTRLCDAEVGRLVTVDLIFDLVEGNLSMEKQKDISDVVARFGPSAWESRVVKAVSLLEVVRDLPRTEINVAATLCDRIDSQPPQPQVKAAIERLLDAKFVRHTEEGYKLQTSSEKTWDTQRRSLDPKPKDRVDIVREIVRDVFSEPSLRNQSYQGRTFKVGITVNDVPFDDGQVPLHIVAADGPDVYPERVKATQTESRDKERENEILWVFALDPEIDGLVADVFRSRQMVAKYDQLKNQGKITPEESGCLANEKNEALRLQGRLRESLRMAIQGGCGLFRGVSRDGSTLGKGLAEAFRRLFEGTLPDLYPKLEMGSRPLKGTEAEEILKAANLMGLSQVFYEGDHGLSLVTKDGAKYVPNENAPVAREVLDFLRQRAAYGEKVTGKDVIARFTGIGYDFVDRDRFRALRQLLGSTDVHEKLDQLKKLATGIDGSYGKAYAGIHEARQSAVDKAIRQLQDRSAWRDLRDELRDGLLSPLASRRCSALDRTEGEAACRNCRATLRQMESDIAAIDPLRIGIESRLLELTAPEERVAHLRAADLCSEPLDSSEALKRFLAVLEAEVQKLLDEGSRVVIQ